MPITVETTTQEIQQFFAEIRAQAQNQVLGKDLPVVGATLSLGSGQVFGTLEAEILNALGTLGVNATVSEIAAKLSTVQGITTVVSGGGIDIALTRSEATPVADGTVALATGAPGIGLA